MCLRFQGLLTKYHGYFPAGSGGGLPGYKQRVHRVHAGQWGLPLSVSARDTLSTQPCQLNREIRGIFNHFDFIIRRLFESLMFHW